MSNNDSLQLSEHRSFNQILNDLRTKGLTYDDLQDDYDLTRWGARKLGNQEILEEKQTGNHQNLYRLPTPNSDKQADKQRQALGDVEVPVQETEEVNHEEQRRDDHSTKQTRTNKINTYLTQLEEEVKNTETPDTEYDPAAENEGGSTMIIHETDPHFSAHVKNRRGEVVYDAEIAAEATENAFDWYIEEGFWHIPVVDEVVLLLGGDLVEGEDIYEGQPHKITDTLEGQIEKARKTYFQQIKRLKKMIDAPIKVVCVSGNHGDLGKTGRSNADDIVYSMLEDMVDLSDLADIKFVKSDRSDYTTFTYRNGKYKGYLTHGENRSNHIGTSSPQSDWLAIKDDIGFDAAWRGHYHVQKVEDVNGAPVCMTNSRKPGDDYTDSIAAFGKTGNAVYFATDDEALAEVKTQTEVLPE